MTTDEGCVYYSRRKKKYEGFMSCHKIGNGRYNPGCDFERGDERCLARIQLFDMLFATRDRETGIILKADPHD